MVCSISIPVIVPVGVTDITGTTANVIGKLTSTGGSFVVERGIIFDIVPNRITLIPGGFGLASHFIKQEVQSVNRAGEFTVSMTNLTPGTCYMSLHLLE